MRPQEFALTVHRGCDRIRVDSIAVMLSVLLALAAVHQPHAQNGPRVSWTFPTASAPNPLKLNWFKEVPHDLGKVEGKNIGKNRAGKTGSTDKSGSQRCEMSPEEFAKFYPPLISWIRNTLTASAPGAQTVASRGFWRLPLYFTQQTLASTKVVLADRLPMPPLSSMGLTRFAEFERGDFDGINLDTLFLKPTQANNEKMHFHELVHVIQWQLLGPDRFLSLYASGLECFGYRQSPLEAMAYEAEKAFASSTAIFDVEKMVAERLGL